MNLLKNEQD